MAEAQRAARPAAFLLLLGLLLVLMARLPGAGASARRPEGPVPAPTDAVPGELLVQYEEGVRAAQARRFEQQLGVASLEQQGAEGRLARLQVAPGMDAAALAARLQGTPGIAYVQPNYRYHATLAPADPFYTTGRLWGLDKIGAPQAWDLTTGSPDVVVAVIDTGIDYHHPDLSANIWTNPGEVNGRPGVDDDGDGYVDDLHGFNAVGNAGDPLDDNGHGTHVSGTIGAVANQVGVVGVCWQVSLMACKFLDAEGNGTTFDAIKCIDYVCRMRDRGVNVVAINASWGGPGADRALRDAIGRANRRGILFVCAAGNGDALGQGLNNDRSPQRNFPSSFNLPNIIAVTATDASDAKAAWANFGAATVDLGAPGVDILSTVPGNAYDTWSGTSMATPHVTGAAALLAVYNPSLTAAQVKDLLLRSVDPVPGLKGLCVSGGRLNVARALSLAPAPHVDPPAAPVGLAVTSLTANAVQLAWTDAAAGAAGYRVLRAGATAEWTPLAALAASATGYRDVAVQPGDTYTYRVEAFNRAGTASSDPVTVTIPIPPAAPGNLQAHVVSPTRVDLEWEIHSTDEAGFNVYRAPAGTAPVLAGTVGPGVRSYTDAAAPGGTTLTYVVGAFNARGEAISDPVTVTTPLDAVHVASLAVTVQHSRQKGRVVYRAVVKAHIVDAGGAPVVGARVSGVFSGATAAGVSGPSQPGGLAVFGSLWQPQRRGAVYTFSITNVALDGCTYRPDQNVITTASATVP
jgi:subtilisin family serine protease